MSTQAQQSDAHELEAILREHDLGWAIDIFAPASEAAAHYLRALRELEKYVKDRGLGTTAFSPRWLRHFVSASPHKAAAFLQALVSIRNIPMLCAAWRIVQGMEIESVEMRYARLSDFSLSVRLKSPSGETEEYESNDINDVALIRHLGKSTMDGRPLFDGFYALRQT